jgi:hypothetical protein
MESSMDLTSVWTGLDRIGLTFYVPEIESVVASLMI